MKIDILRLFGFLTVASILGGCGESKPAAPATDQKPTAATAADTSVAAPAPTAPAPTTVADPTPAAPPTAARVDTTKSSSADVTSQFVTAAKAQGDSVVGAIGNDLADKVKALAQSAGGNDALKSQLTSSMRSLASGNDALGLTSLYQAAQGTSLTPSQMQLAKDVGNLASAYVVQKNFASLEGAQSDVATIANSLRQGQITPAIPAIQKVAQNASLTPTQKQLVASIADKYAPGVTKAAGALQQGLQSVPGFGGSSK